MADGLEKKLSEEMLKIGFLNSIKNDLRTAESVDQKADDYNAFRALMSQDGSVDMDIVLATMSNGDETSRYEFIEGALGNYERSFEPNYEKNKSDILAHVKSRLNAAINGKNKPEAVQILMNYFRDTVDIPKLSETEAKIQTAREASRTYGPSAYTAGLMVGTSRKANSMKLQNYVAEYVESAEQKGKPTRYVIDDKKLAELMEGSVVGSTLYKNIVTVDAAIKKANESKEKPKKA